MSYERTDSAIDQNKYEEETFSMGVNLNELVRITFLEQSARYFGVYCNQDETDFSLDKPRLN